VARKKAPAKTEVDTETPKTDETLPASDAEDTVGDDTLGGKDTLVDTVEVDDSLSTDANDTTDTAGDTIGTDADSIELPEPDRDDQPDTANSLASEDDSIATERDDTPADITPSDFDAEHQTDATATPTVTPTPAEPSGSRGGFFPMVLGGVIAAAIGFAAALGMGGAIPGMGGTAALDERVTSQDQAIADLQDSVGAIDLSDVQATTETNTNAIAELSDRIDGVVSQFDDLAARVTQLEETSITESVSESARAAYEEELARLEEAMRQQREEVEGMVAEAESIRNTAAARSSETQARAAVTNILAALNDGEDFAEPLDQLAETGTEIPQPLTENAEGVATLADLRETFPEAARQALAVTRGAGNTSVGDFFKTQLGVRSLSPKEGDDPDAVLSRAEAAVAAGDIPAALTEIEALPPEAMAELSDWKTAAETRLATVEAANGLMTELNSN